MAIKWILIVASVIILFVMVLGNKKVRMFPLLISQIKVFKNAKTNKISIWDIICFVLMPVVLAVILTIGFGYRIDIVLAGVLTTVFAFVFTVLFGFAAILVGKIDSENAIEKQVVGETFVSIMTTNILSLLAAILSIVLFFSTIEIVSLIISVVIFSFSFIIIMLLLMISKRTFLIYCNNKK